MTPRVYIAAPITKGDREQNWNRAADAQRRLLEAGFAPLNPVLTMALSYAWDVPHALWMQADLPWVRVCHALLRLPGESAGADEEVAFARKHDIRVYYDVDLLIADRGAIG